MYKKSRALAIGAIVLATALFWGCSTKPTLKLDKDTYAPGDKINVQFTAPDSYDSKAWVGIIPSEVAHGSEAENDKYDLAYQYLEKKTSGTLTFSAPVKPGSYDMRMHDTDSDGKEVASSTFKVEGSVPQGSLKLDKTEYKAGQKIQVEFTAPAGLPGNAWVGIIPSDTPHGEESVNDQHDVAYQYLEGKTSGTLTFNAPAETGSWDVRMNSSDNNGAEIASVSFTVK